jgi:outer membrane protein OmpA-like peptidoglycan-associated protein
MDGLFSSNRRGGHGNDDIYSFKSIEQPGGHDAAEQSIKVASNAPFLLVTVVDKDNLPLSDVLLTLAPKKVRGVSQNRKTNFQGQILFDSLDVKTTYDLSAIAKGYLPNKLSVNAKTFFSTGRHEVTLKLKSLLVGSKFKIENINYDYGKAQLRKAAYKELNKTIKFLKENPDIKIELSSHTDSRGSLAYNMQLSRQRAKSCVDYMAKRGISTSRLVVKGYGPTKPIVKRAKTERQHEKNRRTEVKILKINK